MIYRKRIPFSYENCYREKRDADIFVGMEKYTCRDVAKHVQLLIKGGVQEIESFPVPIKNRFLL